MMDLGKTPTFGNEVDKHDFIPMGEAPNKQVAMADSKTRSTTEKRLLPLEIYCKQLEK